MALQQCSCLLESVQKGRLSDVQFTEKVMSIVLQQVHKPFNLNLSNKVILEKFSQFFGISVDNSVIPLNILRQISCFTPLNHQSIQKKSKIIFANQMKTILSILLFDNDNNGKQACEQLLLQLLISREYVKLNPSVKVKLLSSLIKPEKAKFIELMLVLAIVYSKRIVWVTIENFSVKVFQAIVAQNVQTENFSKTLHSDDLIFGFIHGWCSVVLPVTTNMSLSINASAILSPDGIMVKENTNVASVILEKPFLASCARSKVYNAMLRTVPYIEAFSKEINDIEVLADSIMPLLSSHGMVKVKIKDFADTKPIFRNNINHIDLKFRPQLVSKFKNDGFFEVTFGNEIISSIKKEHCKVQPQFPRFAADTTFSEVLQLTGSAAYCIGDLDTLFKSTGELEIKQILTGSLGEVLKGKNIAGINSFEHYLATPGSTFQIHTEDNSYHSVSVHILGGPKLWFNILPCKFREFRSFLKTSLCAEGFVCDNFIQQKFLSIDPKELGNFDVGYSVQEEGEVMIVASGSHHWGINLDFSIAAAANFVNKSWFDDRSLQGLCSGMECGAICRSTLTGEQFYQIGKHYYPSEFMWIEGAPDQTSFRSNNWENDYQYPAQRFTDDAQNSGILSTNFDIDRQMLTFPEKIGVFNGQINNRKSYDILQQHRICANCGKEFRIRSSYNKHKAACGKTKKVKCKICEVVFFGNINSARAHCKRSHVEKGKHAAEIKCCFKDFEIV